MRETLAWKRLRDITGSYWEEVCHDVIIEPILRPVSDSNLVPSTTTTNEGYKSDVSAKGYRMKKVSPFQSLGIHFVAKRDLAESTLHKKSAGTCGFGHIYWRNP